MTQAAIEKMLKKYAKLAHILGDEVSLGLYAYQFCHAKTFLWLEKKVGILKEFVCVRQWKI